MGGCQQKVQTGDHVLWAFDAFNKDYFLKLTPSVLVVKKGSEHTVTVTDGKTGVAIAGAVIDGVTTDANGNAALTFGESGVFKLKAERSDAIRSNALVVVVS